MNSYTAIQHIIDYCPCQGEYEAQCSICDIDFYYITHWGCTSASCKKVARHCLVCDFPKTRSPNIILHSSLSKLSFLCRSSDTQIHQHSSKRSTKCIFLRNKFIFLWLAKRLYMAYSPRGPHQKVTANLSTGGRKGVCQYRQKNNYVELLGQSCLKNMNTFSFLRYTQQAVMPQEWTELFHFLPCVLCSCCGFVFKNHKKKLLEVTNISSYVVTLERSTVNASMCGKFYQTTLKKKIMIHHGKVNNLQSKTFFPLWFIACVMPWQSLLCFQ